MNEKLAGLFLAPAADRDGTNGWHFDVTNNVSGHPLRTSSLPQAPVQNIEGGFSPSPTDWNGKGVSVSLASSVIPRRKAKPRSVDIKPSEAAHEKRN